MASKRVVEAVAKRLAVERLLGAGLILSNIAYNLKQQVGQTLRVDWAQTLGEAQAKWDAAVIEYRRLDKPARLSVVETPKKRPAKRKKGAGRGST